MARTNRRRDPAPLADQQELDFNEPTPGEQIRAVSRAFRLSFNDVGGTRELKAEQKHDIAQEFETSVDRIHTSKKLINAKHPAVQAKNAAKNAVVSFFRSQTLPYPEAGIRLLPTRKESEEERLAEVQKFVADVRSLIDAYFVTARRLQEEWPGVIKQAEEQLGELFDRNDYDDSIEGILGCTFEPVVIELPAYYKSLQPEEYAKACSLLNSKFEAAAQLQEAYVAQLFNRHVNQLLESVTGFHKGEQKSFKNSLVDNVFAAFDEFRNKTKVFGIASGTELESSIDRVMTLLGKGRTGHRLRQQDIAEELRRDEAYREHIMENLETIGKSLAANVRVAPRRRLLMTRTPQQEVTA